MDGNDLDELKLLIGDRVTEIIGPSAADHWKYAPQRVTFDSPNYSDSGVFIPDSYPTDRKLEYHLHEVLTLLGVDWGDINFTKTPARWASFLREFGNHKSQSIREILSPVFPEGHQELIMVRDIPFAALCAHHILPFRGSATVGYVPNEKGEVVGLSKVARAVQFFAQRLTLQERLTSQIADGFVEALAPTGVMVVIQAEHQCMSIRGVKAHEARTVTSAVRGIFKTNENDCKVEFLRLMGDTK